MCKRLEFEHKLLIIAEPKHLSWFNWNVLYYLGIQQEQLNLSYSNHSTPKKMPKMHSWLGKIFFKKIFLQSIYLLHNMCKRLEFEHKLLIISVPKYLFWFNWNVFYSLGFQQEQLNLSHSNHSTPKKMPEMCSGLGKIFFKKNFLQSIQSGSS